MPKVAPRVLVLDGDAVINGRGSLYDAPPDADAPVTFSRLAGALGDNGQVLITGEPGWERLTDPECSGDWTVTGGPAWFTARKGSIRLRVGRIPEINADNDPLMRGNPDRITIAVRHQVFANLTGVPFYGDGGTVALLLLDDTISVKGRQPLRKWTDEAQPKVREDAWPGGGNWECDLREYCSQVTVDRNAQYLSGVVSVYLPLDAPVNTGAVEWDPTATGLYRIRVPKNPEPRLPHPCGRNAMPGIAQWVAHPTMALLHQIGAPPEILDSWTLPRTRSRRAMDPWYEVLKGARAQLLTETDPDSAALMAAVKDTYSRGISHLDRAPERRWYRPDWRAILYANARVSMWRAIWTAGTTYGIWPVSMRADAVSYEEPDAPKALKIGTGMGEWKIK